MPNPDKRPDFVSIDLAEQDPAIPSAIQETRCALHECPGPEGWEWSYGLAGGGMGAYQYCTACEKIISKQQDQSS